MAVFDGNSDWQALWERLNRLLDGARSAGLFVAEGITRELEKQHERWFLWVPVMLGAGIATYFALPFEPQLRWGLVALPVAIALAWRLRNRGGMSLLVILVATAIAGFVTAQIRTALVAAPVLERELRGADVEATVLEAARNEGGGSTLILAPMSISGLDDDRLPARLRVRIGQEGPEIWPGDHIRVRGMFWPPATPVAPEAFDFARQAWFRQLGGTGISFAYPVHIHRPPDPSFSAWINQVRETVARQVMDRMGGEAGAVAAALMTGQRGAIAEDTEQALRDAGLAHILAISGLHMALFAGTLFWIVRAALAYFPAMALSLPLKKIAAIAALVGATAYLFLSGGSVATQRAFIMAVLVFGAMLVDRPALSLRNVALAAIIVLMIAPETLLEPGFQMSFAAATALVAVYQSRELQMASLQGNAAGWQGLARKAVFYAVTLAITSLVAGLATAPFAAYHFNRAAVYGLVGNLIAMPMVGLVIMPSALIAYIAMPLGLDEPALWIMGVGIDLVMAAARIVAGWEGAVAFIPAFPVVSLILVTFAGLLFALWSTHWRWAGGLFIVLAVWLAGQDRGPDILIDRDARLSAVREADGALRLSGRFPTYARESWMRRNGQDADAQISDRRMACDDRGCIATGRIRFAHARTLEAVFEDCQWADVLVSEVPVRGPLRRTCNASVLIDRFDSLRAGAISVMIDEDGIALTRAADVTGNRPWNPIENPIENPIGNLHVRAGGSDAPQ